jgi:multisubunit Na+/H+ antiporter MnhB subunit
MRKILAGIFLVLLVGLLVVGVLSIHPFGEPEAQMDDYIIAHSQAETGSNNVVTAILFDYRGFDTLGEATVLFAAVGSVVLALRSLKKKGKN